MAKKFYWLKMKNNFFQSKRVKKIRKMEDGDSMAIIYIELMLVSLEDEGVLFFEHIEPAFDDEVSLLIDEEPEKVKRLLEVLRTCGLLVQKNDDEYLLTEVAEMVGSESEDAERKRTKRRTISDNVQTTSDNVRTTSDTFGQCPTEKEIEIEKEKDIELEKDKRESKSKTKRKNESESKRECEGESAPTPKNKKFVKPTLEEITAFCAEERIDIDPQHFLDYYTSNGWKVGKNPMKNWKAAVRNWERNDYGNKHKGKAQELNDLYNMDREWGAGDHHAQVIDMVGG